MHSDVCGKSLSTASGVKTLRFHTVEKHHKCIECDDSLPRKLNLKHTTECLYERNVENVVNVENVLPSQHI